MDLRVAVDLARRRGEEARALELREPERVVRPVGADLERGERHPEVVVRARERGEVVDEVERLVDKERLGDVVRRRSGTLVADVLDVRERAADEVVDADDAMAALEQVVAEMRAEEAGSSGDQGRRHAAMLAELLQVFVALHVEPHREQRELEP